MARALGSLNATIRSTGSRRTSDPVVTPVNYSDTPANAEWRRTFPVGVFVDMSGEATINGVTRQMNQWVGWQAMIEDPTVGLLATGLTAVVTTNGQVYAHETVQQIFTNLEADARYRTIKYAHSVESRINLANLNPDVTYWPDAFTHDDTNAATFAVPIAAVMDAHPGLLAYNLKDDVSTSSSNGSLPDRAAPMIRQQEAADSHGRAAMIVSADETAMPVIDTDAHLMYRYAHPVGYYSDNVAMPEGDFHLFAFPGALHDEFVSWYRYFTSFDPAGLVNWCQIQCHQTTSGGATRKKYPTGREITAMSWMMVGEGAKGIFYFTWNDDGAGVWVGLCNTASTSRLNAASSFARRLTPTIRARLLKTDRATDAFSVSGGGSSGYRVDYSDAYVSTLYDAGSDVSYAVVVNHSTSTATITVSGTGTLSGETGTLTNLEDGSTLALGGSVSLGALDGSIWRYDG